MKIAVDALLEAVSILDRVPTRTGIASSEFVRLVSKKGMLHLSLASDLVGNAKVPIEDPQDFTFFVERRLLFPFLSPSKGRNKPFTLSLDGDGLQIQEGRRKGRYGAVDAQKGYSSGVPDGEKEVKISDTLKEELRLAAKYASVDQLAPELACVWLDAKRNGVYATNKFSVFFAETEVKSTGPLPGSFPELLSGSTSVMVSAEGARILFPSGWLSQSFNEKALKEFPRKSIDASLEAAKGWKSRLKIQAGKLMDALTRLGGYVAGASSDETVINVVCRKGDAVLDLVSQATQATFKEAIKMPEPQKADWSAIWLLPSIRPFLEACDPKAELTVRWDEDSPYLFHDSAAKRWLISPRKVTK